MRYRKLAEIYKMLSMRHYTKEFEIGNFKISIHYYIMFYSSFVDRIAGEGSQAWELHYEAKRLSSEGKDVINLCVGDPNFDAPVVATDAAIEAIKSKDTHYAEISGRTKLLQAISNDFQMNSGIQTTSDNVIFMAGAQNALYSVCQCLFDHGDEVIVLEPTYVTYEATIQSSGATWKLVSTPSSSDFRLDPIALRNAITNKTKGIVFCNPNNPTGVVMSYEELEQISQIAIEFNLWVVSDEVYRTITFERSHISIASLPHMIERTVTISSLSKSHAMPGFRCGWVIGPIELIQHLGNLALCMTYGLPGFIQEAAYEAITNGQNEALMMKVAYQRRRDIVINSLSSITSLNILCPEGGMMIMININQTNLSAKEFANKLLYNYHVALLPADAFGPSALGYLRLSLGVDDESLIEATNRIKLFCKENDLLIMKMK